MGCSLAVFVATTIILSSCGIAESLPVLVHDYAGVKPEMLAHAEAEATRVLATGGLEVTWTNCTESGMDPEVCGRRPGLGAVVVQILPGGTSTRNMQRDTVGFAAPADSSVFGGYACVFYDRVEALRSLELGTAVLLGHVIAHEIGHLLLGIDGHSKNGIMAGAWNSRSLVLAARGQLVFDGRQRRRMTHNVARRLELARADNMGREGGSDGRPRLRIDEKLKPCCPTSTAYTTPFLATRLHSPSYRRKEVGSSDMTQPQLFR
jgi:hypothetical protein